MELMIAHPLMLPDRPLEVTELEEVVCAWGREIQRQAFAAAWERQQALRPPVPCPACGETDLCPAGHKPRKVETSFGPVWLPRQRVRCAACARHFQPDDAALAPAVGAGRLSPRLRDLAALCGASWPYRQAAEVLGKLRGVPLSHEAIRTVVDEVGARVATAQAAEGAAACAPPSRTPARCTASTTAVIAAASPFMSTAHRPPDLAVGQLGGEREMCPGGGITGGDDVAVAVDDERPCAVAAGPPSTPTTSGRPQ